MWMLVYDQILWLSFSITHFHSWRLVSDQSDQTETTDHQLSLLQQRLVLEKTWDSQSYPNYSDKSPSKSIAHWNNCFSIFKIFISHGTMKKKIETTQVSGSLTGKHCLDSQKKKKKKKSIDWGCGTKKLHPRAFLDAFVLNKYSSKRSLSKCKA